MIRGHQQDGMLDTTGRLRRHGAKDREIGEAMKTAVPTNRSQVSSRSSTRLERTVQSVLNAKLMIEGSAHGVKDMAFRAELRPPLVRGSAGQVLR